MLAELLAVPGLYWGYEYSLVGQLELESRKDMTLAWLFLIVKDRL